MKVGARCGYCLLYRGYQQILRVTDDESVRREAVEKLLKLLGEEYDENAVAAIIGSKRDRIIHEVTGCPDPYMKMKKNANRVALKMLPEMEALIFEKPAEERFKLAILIACIGNVIEYDVPDHSPDIAEVFARLDDEDFCIDDLDSFRKLLGDKITLLYLTDNAGEIVFDRLVVRELQKLGCRVTVAVKGGASLNDALMIDAEASGMVGEANLVITTGSDAVGINLSEVSEEFLKAYQNADIILSKGMANWETLTEYEAPCPTMFLFRTKCEPVASAIGVPQQENIAKLVPKNWKL